jgi:uncharacterized protein
MLKPSRYIMTMRITQEKYLFVNTFTGAILLGTEKIRKILKGDTITCDEETLSELVSGGFLTELTPQEEIKCAFERLKSAQNLYAEHTLFALILTYQCNMRCSYCFESYLFKKEESWLQQTMTTDMVDAAFEAMETLNPATRIPVHLFGGEPLMSQNYELVKYILEKGKSHNKQFLVVTNGLEADKFIPLLTQSDITSLQITVDGIQEIHDARRKKRDGTGTFHKIVRNIDLLADSDLQTYIKVIFDHSTVKTLPALMAFFTEKGWDDHKNIHYFLTPAGHHTGGGCFNFLCDVTPEDLEFLLQYKPLQRALWQGLAPLRKKLGLGVETWLPSISYCRYNPSQTWFDPLGDLYFCTDSLGDPEHAVGRYYPCLSFNDNYHQWKKRTIFHMKSCRLCKYAMICGGGCGHYVYHEKGSLLHPDCTFPKQARTVYYPLLVKMIESLDTE